MARCLGSAFFLLEHLLATEAALLSGTARLIRRLEASTVSERVRHGSP
jgi:hypothetical protein